MLEELVELREQVDRAVAGDFELRGQLLRSTMARVFDAIEGLDRGEKGPFDGKAWSPAELATEWKRLVEECLEQYVTERQILEHGLVLEEYRPRNYFNVLQDFAAVKWRSRQAGELSYKFRRISNAGPGREDLTVLLAVRNGFRRTYRALAGLCKDIRVHPDTAGLRVGFHVCINYSDDNSLYEVARFARTMARTQRIDVVQYLVEDPANQGDAGGTDWTKTQVLNLMLRDVRSSCRPDSYLHFADDDILVPTDTGVVAKNIRELKRNDQALVVSAAYTSRDARAFSAVSCVRKQPKYVMGDHKLMNVYGGAMTTTAERLREVVGDELQFVEHVEGSTERVGEDAWVTIFANRDVINGKAGSDAYRAYALCSNLVEHPEEASLAGLATRALRDNQWGAHTAREVARKAEIVAPDPHQTFQVHRAASFEPIADAINERGGARDFLAQLWGGTIREALAEPNKPNAREFSRWIDWSRHKTQHQICQEIARDDIIFRDVCEAAAKGAFGADLMRCLAHAEADRPGWFPEISSRLVEKPRDTVLPALARNPHLFNWYAIAEESVAVASQLLHQAGRGDRPSMGRPAPRPRVYERLKARYPVDLTEALCELEGIEGPVELQPADPESTGLPDQPESGWRFFVIFTPSDRAFSFYLRGISAEGAERRLFMRYYPVVGVGALLTDSPRRIVYLHCLGEALIRLFWGSGSRMSWGATRLDVVKSLYPSLDAATINYFGPQRTEANQRFQHSILIEESLEESTYPLTATIAPDSAWLDIAQCFGRAFGELHGTTLGLRSKIDDDRYLGDSVGKDLFALLVEHLDQIRIFEYERYEDWLLAGCDRASEVQDLLGGESRGADVRREVTSLLEVEGRNLKRLWQTLCQESANVYSKFGALAHMGIYRANLQIGAAKGVDTELGDGQQVRVLEGSPGEVERVYVASHSGVAVVDPALEAGLVLADLMASRLVSGSFARRLIDEKTGSEKPSAWTVNDTSLNSIRARFVSDYRTQVERAHASTPWVGSKEEAWVDLTEDDLNGLESRLNRFAAIFLLAQTHARLEHEMPGQERRQVVRACIDLIHMTYPRTLRTRFD